MKDYSFDMACVIVGTFCFTQALNDSEDDRKTMADELDTLLAESFEQTGVRDLEMEMAIGRLR